MRAISRSRFSRLVSTLLALVLALGVNVAPLAAAPTDGASADAAGGGRSPSVESSPTVAPQKRLGA